MANPAVVSEHHAAEHSRNPVWPAAGGTPGGDTAALVVFWLRAIRLDSSCDPDRDRGLFPDHDVSLLPAPGGCSAGEVSRIKRVFSHRGGKFSGLVIQDVLLGNLHGPVAIVREHDGRVLAPFQRHRVFFLGN